MTPLDSGEFGLIRRIQEMLDAMPPSVVLGPGDDTAVFRPEPGRDLLLTTDAMAEGVHFDRSFMPLSSVGWKSLAANLSDIAAMGGRPLYAVVSLGIPAGWTSADAEALVAGMKRCGDAYGCTIVGGDISAVGSEAFIAVALTGDVARGRAVKRGGAAAGDLICVTGTLGGSRTGLEVLRSGVNREEYGASIGTFLEPVPRTGEAASLIAMNNVSAMIDISDGLSSEIHHICGSSGTGCRIRSRDVPVSPEAARWARERGAAALEYALGSGEEYELLFTVRGQQAVTPPPETRVAVIGEILPADQGIRILVDDEERPLVASGWDHFRQ
ncbi:thiamine-phosphate kinase [bacterium]|nr:thiamine-phosphate kinase [bacterium]